MKCDIGEMNYAQLARSKRHTRSTKKLKSFVLFITKKILECLFLDFVRQYKTLDSAKQNK